MATVSNERPHFSLEAAIHRDFKAILHFDDAPHVGADGSLPRLLLVCGCPAILFFYGNPCWLCNGLPGKSGMSCGSRWQASEHASRPALCSIPASLISQPEDDGCGEGYGGKGGFGAPVAAGGDPSPVLQPAEHDLVRLLCLSPRVPYRTALLKRFCFHLCSRSWTRNA